MPLYEYMCLDCGKSFELIVGFSENNTKKECPHCRSERTNRLISTFASLGSGNSITGNASSCSSNSRFT